MCACTYRTGKPLCEILTQTNITRDDFWGIKHTIPWWYQNLLGQYTLIASPIKDSINGSDQPSALVQLLSVRALPPFVYQYRNGKLFKVNILAKKIIRAIFLCIIREILMHVIFEFVTCKIASWLEDILAEIARQRDALQMVCLNVPLNVGGRPFLFTHFTNAGKTVSLSIVSSGQVVFALFHHWLDLLV